MILLHKEVTELLDNLDHSLRKEIDMLRKEILTANAGLTENVKWNGPNYCYHNEDRITMRVQPPKQIQLVFHRGAKVLAQPANRLINDVSGLMVWKTNDRAVITFKNAEDISTKKMALRTCITEWIAATT